MPGSRCDAEQSGQIYNITSENLTQAELLGLACEIFGLDVRYEVMSDEACIQKFRTLMPERGEAVAHMLTGCFQSIRAGAFDVPSHFREAAGRPAEDRAGDDGGARGGAGRCVGPVIGP